MNQIALPSHLMPPRINEMEHGHWHWRALTQKFAADLAAHVAGMSLESLSGYVRLEIMVANRADWDARLKSLCDGLQAIGVVENDAQIVSAEVRKAAKDATDQHHAVLVRWLPATEVTTEAIEAWWGAPVKAKKTARKVNARQPWVQ